MTDYLDLGYDTLLKKPSPIDLDNGINESNEDQIIETGSITWGKIDPNGDAPEAGADVTGDNISAGITGQGDLAILDQVDTAEIVNGAVEKVKMALLSVDADVLAASAVTTVKIDDDAITSPKILARTILAGNIGVGEITATEISVSQLDAISANVGELTAGLITGLTITGGTIQTTNTTYPAVKITSSGIDIHGQTMNFRDTTGGLFGYVYGSGSFNIKASTGRNLVLGAGSDIIVNPDGNDFYPNVDNDINLGTSSNTWKTLHAQTVNALDKITLTSYDVLDTFLTSVYLKGRGGSIQIQPTDGTTLFQVEATKVFSPASSETIELGDSSHYWEKVYTKDINVNNKISLNPLTAFPSGVQGDLCVRTDGKLYIYDGSSWTLVGSQT